MSISADSLHFAPPAEPSLAMGVIGNCAFSALIDARGRITAQTPLFERTVLVGDVAPLRAPGLYAAWGNWFAWSCVAISLALLLRQLTRRV
jgi:apolipoprotein N-acyltransferase